MSTQRNFDICIVGGCGHVGLPLGLAFADRGQRVVLYDINKHSVTQVNSAQMPFLENGAPAVLARVVANGRLLATSDATVIGQSQAIIMVVGTPVDEHLNPRLQDIFKAVADIGPYIDDKQLLIMRSTLYPGVTNMVFQRLQSSGRQIDVAFCPERIAEGHALTELFTLPQIISGCTPGAIKRAGELFALLAPEVIELSTIEAELAKLYANNLRYILFAAANQFFMIAQQHGLDYAHILEAVTRNYPRLSMLPGAGFAAGPCLFKDTMQLAAFSEGTFFLGHAAMLVNEGLPDFVVTQLAASVENLHTMTVGILGMAFKAGSDDPRESLSYKLRKKIEMVAGEVLCTDVYIEDDRFVSLDELLRRADIIVVGTPHAEYRQLEFGGKPVIDIWNLYGNGSRI